MGPQPLWGWGLDAKIHRLHLWLFTFNPFGVGVCPLPFPQVAPVAIYIQPLWGVPFTFSTGCTCGYSHSTPLGVKIAKLKTAHPIFLSLPDPIRQAWLTEQARNNCF